MELHQLRYFLAVAETRSFSRAAERCGVAQPSLSQQIRKLEDELGYRLFDRLPRGVLLTEVGASLLPRARTILGEVRAVDAAIRADLEEGRGAFRVGAIPTMAPYLLPRVLPRFLKTFPACELTVREDLTDRLVEALLDHELDLAIMSTPIENEAIQLKVLGKERLLVVAGKGYPLPEGDAPLGLRDLRDAPTVVLHEMHCLGQQVDVFCAAKRVPRRIVCRSTQLATVLRLVEVGLGISMVPEMCARADRGGERAYRSLGRGGPTREIAAAFRVDRTVPQVGHALIDLMREDLQAGVHAYDG